MNTHAKPSKKVEHEKNEFAISHSKNESNNLQKVTENDEKKTKYSRDGQAKKILVFKNNSKVSSIPCIYLNHDMA